MSHPHRSTRLFKYPQDDLASASSGPVQPRWTIEALDLQTSERQQDWIDSQMEDFPPTDEDGQPFGEEKERAFSDLYACYPENNHHHHLEEETRKLKTTQSCLPSIEALDLQTSERQQNWLDSQMEDFPPTDEDGQPFGGEKERAFSDLYACYPPSNGTAGDMAQNQDAVTGHNARAPGAPTHNPGAPTHTRNAGVHQAMALTSSLDYVHQLERLTPADADDADARYAANEAGGGGAAGKKKKKRNNNGRGGDRYKKKRRSNKDGDGDEEAEPAPKQNLKKGVLRPTGYYAKFGLGFGRLFSQKPRAQSGAEQEL